MAVLIEQAREVGLRVSRDGDDLLVKGPKTHTSLALQLLDRKIEVLAELDPAEAKRRRDHEKNWHHSKPVLWWQTPLGNWECSFCHRDPSVVPAVATSNGARPTEPPGLRCDRCEGTQFEATPRPELVRCQTCGFVRGGSPPRTAAWLRWEMAHAGPVPLSTLAASNLPGAPDRGVWIRAESGKGVSPESWQRMEEVLWNLGDPQRRRWLGNQQRIAEAREAEQRRLAEQPVEEDTEPTAEPEPDMSAPPAPDAAVRQVATPDDGEEHTRGQVEPPRPDVSTEEAELSIEAWAYVHEAALHYAPDVHDLLLEVHRGGCAIVLDDGELPGHAGAWGIHRPARITIQQGSASPSTWSVFQRELEHHKGAVNEILLLAGSKLRVDKMSTHSTPTPAAAEPAPPPLPLTAEPDDGDEPGPAPVIVDARDLIEHNRRAAGAEHPPLAIVRRDEINRQRELPVPPPPPAPSDPRPDLVEDSPQWEGLLPLAQAEPDGHSAFGCYAQLRDYRRRGAQLRRVPSEPEITTSAEDNQRRWRRELRIPGTDFEITTGGGGGVSPSDLTDLIGSYGRVLARLLNRLQEKTS